MANYSDILEQAGRQFNVDPKLLALVMGQESGGNAGAVSPKGARGPMQVMPGTAKDMGVTDPADPVQNIMAGAKYLSQQLDKYKDVPTALAAYNAGPGAVDKHGGIPPFPETQGYVKSIMSAYQGGGAQASAAAATAPAMPGLPPVAGASTPSTPTQVGAQPAQMPGLPPTLSAAANAASAPTDPFSALVAKAGGVPASSGQAAASTSQADPFSQLVAKVGGAGPATVESPTINGKPWQAPGGFVMGMGDTLKGGLEAMLHAGTWVGDKIAPDAQITKDAHTALNQLASNNQMQDAAYQASRAQAGGSGFDGKRMAGSLVAAAPLVPALGGIGGAGLGGVALRGSIAGGVGALAMPVEDPTGDYVGQKLEQAGTNALVGAGLGVAGSVVGRALKPVASAVAANPLVDRLVVQPAATALQKVGDAFDRKRWMGDAAGAGRSQSATPAPALSGVGAASANLNPYPALSGQEAARGGSALFPQVKLSKIAGDVPADEQAVRAQIANEILGEEHGAVRPGVITGNEDTLRSEYTHAKSPENTPAQLVLRNQIAKEQQALSDYAQARVEATGANPNLINNEQRGQIINDAFHGEGGLADYFKQAKQQIYDRAKAESGSNPIQSTHVDALLSDPQFLAEAERNGHTGVVSGAQKLIDLARTTGFKDPITGEAHAPGSVGAWDAVRKSNNAGWSPDNARTIAAINRAIDQDVAAAAGSDAYKLGDAIHKAEKTIMDTPAIAKVFGGIDANGIKDGVALEKLPARLNNMPIDQWKHVYNTLDDLSRGQVRNAPEGMPPVPDELRQAAQAARNEMAGALAREVYEQGAGKAGVWNQNSANKTLNSIIGQKIVQTFPPDEVQRFHALNLGGQIMPGVHSYEGAAHQAQRLSKPGMVEKHAGKAGAVAGGVVGAAINPWLGGPGTQSGAVLGAKIAGRSTSKRLEGESNKLLDAMKANSKLGRQGQGNRLTGH